MAPFFICLVLLLIMKVNSEDVAQKPSGPVTAVMENFTYGMLETTEEIQLNLASKTERSENSLLGNSQVIIAAAMDQLADVIFQANQKLFSGNCPQPWTMQELLQRIDKQLTCTSGLLNFRTVFQNNNAALLQGLQTYIAELLNLPASCELLDASQLSVTSFASGANCFVQRLAEINRNISQTINDVNVSLVRARRSAHFGVTMATECAERVVADVVRYLNEAFENC